MWMICDIFSLKLTFILCWTKKKIFIIVSTHWVFSVMTTIVLLLCLVVVLNWDEYTWTYLGKKCAVKLKQFISVFPLFLSTSTWKTYNQKLILTYYATMKIQPKRIPSKGFPWKTILHKYVRSVFNAYKKMVLIALYTPI